MDDNQNVSRETLTPEFEDMSLPEPAPQEPFPFNTNMPMKKYILRMGLISLIPSLFIVFLLAAAGIMTEKTRPNLSKVMVDPVIGFFSMVIISPAVETLMMSFFLFLLSLITKHRIKLAALSAVLWACIHSLLAPAWGLGVIWPFFIFSCAYLAWRPRSFLRALWVTFWIHVFQNFFPGLIILFNAL